MGTLSLIQQRNKDLREAYSQIMKSGINPLLVSRRVVVNTLSKLSAPRFYISPYWAGIYIRGYYKGLFRDRRKNAMIEDLVENWEMLCAQYPTACREVLYEMLVECKAKSFYMSNQRIKEIVFNYRGR